MKNASKWIYQRLICRNVLEIGINRLIFYVINVSKFAKELQINLK